MNDTPWHPRPEPIVMGDTPDGGIRPSGERIETLQRANEARALRIERLHAEEHRLRERVRDLSIEVDRLQMENAELRYERDKALYTLAASDDGYSNGEVWAS